MASKLKIKVVFLCLIMLDIEVFMTGGYAFLKYKELDNIFIPESVMLIGRNPFVFCDQLRSIEIDEEISISKWQMVNF